MLANVSYVYFKRVNLPVSLSPAEMTFLMGEMFKRRVLMSIFPVFNIWSDMWPKKSCVCKCKKDEEKSLHGSVHMPTFVGQVRGAEWDIRP